MAPWLTAGDKKTGLLRECEHAIYLLGLSSTLGRLQTRGRRLMGGAVAPSAVHALNCFPSLSGWVQPLLRSSAFVELS